MVTKKSKRQVTRKAETKPTIPPERGELELPPMPDADLWLSDEEIRKIFDDPSWEKIKNDMDQTKEDPATKKPPARKPKK